MMNKKFANPYIIYYPVVSRDGMPFPVNRTVRDIQEELNKGPGGRRMLHEDQLWRGNLVAAKFADNHFVQMMDASMADFPILKNFLATHPSPIRITSSTSAAAQPAPTPPTPPSLPPLHSTSTSPQQQQQQQLHSQGFPAAGTTARQAHMQYAEPAAGSSSSSSIHPPAYEGEPAASSSHGGHGVPAGTVLTLRRDPRTGGAGVEQQQYIHPMEL
jgi:hypothetical protein